MGRLRRAVQGPFAGRYSAAGGIEPILRQAGGQHGFCTRVDFGDSRLGAPFVWLVQHWVDTGGSSVEARGSLRTPSINPRVTVLSQPRGHITQHIRRLSKGTPRRRISHNGFKSLGQVDPIPTLGLSHDSGDGIRVGTNFWESL